MHLILLCSANLQAVALLPMSAEFGSPPWLFGTHSYEVIAGGAAVLAVFDDPAAAGQTAFWDWLLLHTRGCRRLVLVP